MFSETVEELESDFEVSSNNKEGMGRRNKAQNFIILKIFISSSNNYLGMETPWNQILKYGKFISEGFIKNLEI